MTGIAIRPSSTRVISLAIAAIAAARRANVVAGGAKVADLRIAATKLLRRSIRPRLVITTVASSASLTCTVCLPDLSIIPSVPTLIQCLHCCEGNVYCRQRILCSVRIHKCPPLVRRFGEKTTVLFSSVIATAKTIHSLTF